MITFAKNDRKFDHLALNSITIWDGLRMPNSEHASMLLYAHVSCLILILYFVSDLMQMFITKLILRSTKVAWLPLTKTGYFVISVTKLPSREATRCTANEEIFPVSWKNWWNFRVRNRLPLLPILSQMYPVHTLLSHSLLL